MSEYNKNLRNNQGNLKHSKGQQRKRTNQTADIPPYLKGLFDDLAPPIKNFLNKAAESQARVSAARGKLMDTLPEIIQQTIPARRESRKRKITPRKQELLDLINKLRDERMTYEEVAAYLQENNIPTFSGRGRWHAQTIHRLYMYPP